MKGWNEKYRHYSVRKIIRSVDRRYGLGAWERIFASNWFNPFYTFYLNFRSFPYKQALRLPFFVYGFPRFYCLSGRMEIEGKLTTGMLKFNKTMPGGPSNMALQSEINNQGLIVFKGKGLIGTGNKIFVAPDGRLELGKHFKITDGCNIGCFTIIQVGEQSRITHRCQLLDSNYHYVADFEKRTVPYHSRPIRIGKGCWICHSSTVAGGSVLPDFTIVASHSLINRDYSVIPPSSLLGGSPAKLLRTGWRKIENSIIEKRVLDYYMHHPDGLYRIPSGDTPDLYSFVDYFK